MVSVAQLVEPRIVIPVVVGSNPIVHPNLAHFDVRKTSFPVVTYRESGGIGRRAGFRFQWGNLWEFESPLSHHFCV